MRWYDEKLWSRLVIGVIIGLLATFLLAGCRTTRYVPMERVVEKEVMKHDTLVRNDSVWVHDSVMVRMEGDTKYVDRWHTKLEYRNVYRNRVDSFIKRDSIPVPYPVEKELSSWQKAQLKMANWLLGVVVLVVIYFLWKLYRRRRNANTEHRNQER